MLSHYVKSLECIFDGLFKQDAAHEPECSHEGHLWETKRLNSPRYFALLPNRSLWGKGWKMQSKRVDCTVRSVECEL